MGLEDNLKAIWRSVSDLQRRTESLETQESLDLYDSAWFEVAANSSYVQSHGLGRQAVSVDVWFSTSTGGSAATSINYYNLGAAGSTTRGCQIYNSTTTGVTVKTLTYLGLDSGLIWVSSGYYRVLVRG